ncbi:MAG: hypothetical protein ACJZ4H_02735 [Candidatus Pelagibacter sp.]
MIKKLLEIMVLSLLWCGTVNAEDIQLCKWVVDEAYADVLKEYPKEKRYFYVVKGDNEKCEYGHGQDETSGFSDCEKNRKENGINGECKLFAIGKKKVLKYKTESKYNKEIEKNFMTSNEVIKTCHWIISEAYVDVFTSHPKEKRYFYVVKGDDERCEYGHGHDANLGLKDCEKNRDVESINGECKLLAIGKKILKYETQWSAANVIFKDGLYTDCDVITKKDPTIFQNLSFIYKNSVDGYDRRKELYQDRLTSNNEGGWINFEAFIFRAEFEKGPDIHIRVNSEFKTKKKAEKQALKYAKIVGQSPQFLNSWLRNITIHKGDKAWGAVRESGDILIHTGMLKRFKKCKEEVFIHELAHITLDPIIGIRDERMKEFVVPWQKAMEADNKFISKYAKDYPHREDVAETINWWIAVRCKPDKISKSAYKKITEGIPNRLKYLDEKNYDTYPLVCK